MKEPKIILITLIILVLSATLSLAGNSEGNSGGFFQGLLGPIILLLQSAGTLFQTTDVGSAKFAVLWEQTWGQGSTSYRIGFIVGAIILISIFGGLGGSATKGATKKDEQK